MYIHVFTSTYICMYVYIHIVLFVDTHRCMCIYMYNIYTYMYMYLQYIVVWAPSHAGTLPGPQCRARLPAESSDAMDLNIAGRRSP